MFNSGSGANLSLLAYAYDHDDNIVAITDGVDPARSVQYAYDNRGRLAQSVAASGTPKRADYGFDKNGNHTQVDYRAEATDPSPMASDSYARTAGTNRLASVTTAAGVRAIAYDARGNSLSESRPGGVTVAAAYDGHGRLLTYARTGEAAQDNSYNGLDERVAVTTSDGVTSTARASVYDVDHRLIGEYGASVADPIAETIWLQPEVANDNQVMGGDDGVGGYAPLAVATGSGTSAALHWVHGNHLGVPVVTTDASGAAVTPTGYTMPGFPGQTRTLSDLYHNRHRDYDSSTGRYIQADPIGLGGGSNLYLYAEGNPLRFTDPLGLATVYNAVGSAIVRDLSKPDRSDLNPYKWAGYGAASLIALGIDAYLDYCNGSILQNQGRPRGYWPADKGAEAWGRKNGIGKDAGRRRFHGIKEGDGPSRGDDDYGVNPDTGDVVDPDGESIGNLND